MGLNDPQDFDQRLANARRRLAESDDVHDADVPAIEAWLRRKDGQVAVSSLATYLRRVHDASKRSTVPLVEMDEAEYHNLVFELRHDHGLADSTVKSYEDAVLMFLADETDHEWVEDVERTSVDTGGLDIDDMLDPADIQALTAAARHQRDVAFIEFLADTGARISLALSLRVKDISLGDRPTYRPNKNAQGLKGAAIREYPLIDAVAPLRGYLQGSHPRADDPDVALFHKIKPYRLDDGERRWTDDGSVRVSTMRQQLYRIADRADIDKPVKPHAFRHAAITRMVREGYSRSQIEHRVHWTLDTDMWETYEHVTGTEHNDDIFRAAGIIDEEQGPDRVRKRCGQCTEPLAPHHEYCSRCGTAATKDAREEVDEKKGTVLSDMVNAMSPQARDELKELLEFVDRNEDVAQADPS